MTLAEGMIIAEHYQLLSQLGQGSFGDVWLAHNMLADIDVAIKFYGTFDEKGLNEFRNEFKLAYKLNHPNLLNISHFDVYENCPYLVMPYCANGSVGKRIGQMPEPEIWKFVHDVAGGLAFLHSQQPAVIHQDIKPDNILITSDGRYVISDFGISRNLRTQMSRTMNTQNSSGTLAYMGPERFSEHPLVVLASDIWAFGMTLYEVITGDVLWEGMGGCVQLNGARIPSIKGVSANLEKLVCACLAAETWNRPTASQIFDYAAAYIQNKPLPHLGNSVAPDPKPIAPSKPVTLIPEPRPATEPMGVQPTAYKPVNYQSQPQVRRSVQSQQRSTKRIALITAACLAAILLVSGIVLFVNYISEEQAFVSCKTRQDYEQFINDYPSSSHVKTAQKRIKALTAPVAPLVENPVAAVPKEPEKPASVETSLGKQQSPAVKRGVVQNPKPVHAKTDDRSKSQQQSRQVPSNTNNVSDDRMFYSCTNLNDYYAYLNLYPNGRHRAEANQMILKLNSRGDASIVNSHEPENQPIRPNESQSFAQPASQSSTSVNINLSPTIRVGGGGGGSRHRSTPRSSGGSRSSGPARSTAPRR